MFRFYPLVIVLEVFCLYHAYKNKVDQKWYWIIFIFPLLGSIAYLYHHFYSRANVDNVAEELKGVLNSNYHTKKLEKELNHCNSTANKLSLANEYLLIGRYKEAKNLYESCHTNQNDPEVLIKLLKANHLDDDFEQAVIIGDKLKGNRTFENSEEKIYYAWALYKLNQIDLAEKIFVEMNDRYSNYPQRLEYCKFLGKINKPSKALSNLEELLAEWKDMNRLERKLNRGLNTEIKALYNKINS